MVQIKKNQWVAEVGIALWHQRFDVFPEGKIQRGRKGTNI